MFHLKPVIKKTNFIKQQIYHKISLVFVFVVGISSSLWRAWRNLVLLSLLAKSTFNSRTQISQRSFVSAPTLAEIQLMLIFYCKSFMNQELKLSVTVVKANNFNLAIAKHVSCEWCKKKPYFWMSWIVWKMKITIPFCI